MWKIKLRQILFATLLLLFIIGSPGSGFNGDGQDDILVMGPDRQRFAPEAEKWTIQFTLVDTGVHIVSPKVSLSGVRVNDRPVNLNDVELLFEEDGRVPVMRTARYIPKRDMMEYYEIRKEPELLDGIVRIQQDRFDWLTTENIEDTIWATPELSRPENSNAIIIPTEVLGVRNNEEYELSVEFDVTWRGGTDTIGFDTDITVVSLISSSTDRQPDSDGFQVQSITDGQWIPGDFHVHSTNSDGRRDPEVLMQMHIDAGFHMAYFTDAQHTKELVTNEEWLQIKEDYMLLSSTTFFTVFPGLETAVNPDDDGHLLVYGIDDNILGLEENLKNHQEMIDEALANNPSGPTSSAIAHPACHFFPWEDFNVFGYHGIEIMVGGVPGLGGTGLGAGNVESWRSEMARLQSYIIDEGGYVPSARTGTDYHGYPLEMFRDWVTWVYVPEPWDSYNYHQKKAAIDRSLYDGITTVSRHGAFGNFTLDGELVGSVIHGVDPGTVLPLEVEYRAAGSGTVRVRIFRRDMFETVFDETVTLGVGATAYWSDEIIFPGGDHYYWLYAEGPEDVYTTAIYVTGKGYNVNLYADPEEGGTVSGAGNYDPGETVVVEATPHPDYYFYNWTEDGVEVTRDEVYTFTSERHRNLTANFRPKVFNFVTTNISAGITSYLIDEDGNVFGWRGEETQEISKDAWGGLRPVDVSVGNSYCRDYEYVFVVLEDGSVWSWGTSNYGQLGHGEAEQVLATPKKITSTDWGGHNVVSVHAGNYANHVFAVTEDGNLWSWGHFRHTGVPAPEEGYAITVPTKIDRTRYVHGSGTLISTSEAWNGENVINAAVGTSLNIAVTSDGNIWTWGTGALQLGHGTSHNTMDRPTVVDSTNWGGSKVATAAAGNGYGAVLTEDGSVWTWGRSSAGQDGAEWSVLGHGDTEDKPVPAKITSTNWGGALVTKIAAGNVHMNVLTGDGHVWAWGRNYKGELGFGDDDDRTVPEKIETTDWDGQQVVDISTVRIHYPNRALQTGDLYNLALTFEGKLWSWGNQDEQLIDFPEQLQ